MKFSNVSIITNKLHTIDLNIDENEFNNCMKKWENGYLIQHAFPMLTPEEREFILNGITPDEWDYFIVDDEYEES